MLPFPTACLTPAYAGQTVGRDCGLAPSSLYPHARGANARPSWTRPGRTPLPPRTWGKRSPSSDSAHQPASTPTHVGQTLIDAGMDDWASLYPHARGANPGAHGGGKVVDPLPPRTWGKLDHARLQGLRVASTPTHVGQTRGSSGARLRPGLYPHARGANPSLILMRGDPRPLPPRTWGKPAQATSTARLTASTPTHVGQTLYKAMKDGTVSLYPHARGANYFENMIETALVPLPPRTWGKHGVALDGAEPHASTPTHVGQTSLDRPGRPGSHLYPHARGANSSLLKPKGTHTPLPPRTWGKPTRPRYRAAHPASTPTHVGQTNADAAPSRAQPLYPHARGANRKGAR